LNRCSVSFFLWLEQTRVSVGVPEAPTPWAFPVMLYLRTLGPGIVAGSGFAFNRWPLAYAHSGLLDSDRF
jgi:hypothetical protein